MKFKPGTYETSELIDRGVLRIGDGYRAKNSELATKGIPFARAGNINNGFQFDDADLFPLEDIGRIGDKKSKVFDSVFTSKGTVGRIAYVKEGTQEFVYSPQLCYWRSLDFEVIDPRFLNFWMNGSEFKNQIDYLKGQTDMADYVSLRDQRKMTISVPEIAAQRNIAEILGALDDRIELNRQINQTLEQIAQTLFKSWFVDFEPVTAKIAAKAAGRDPERAAMCAISGKLEPELAQLSPEQRHQLAATAALFPDELVESELGLIPEGWEVKRIKEVVKRYSVGEKYSQKTASEVGSVPILDQGRSGVIGYHSNKPGVKASPDDPIIVFANHTCYMRLMMHDFSAIQNVLPFKGVGLNLFWLYAATFGKQEFVEYKGHWPDFEIKEIVVPSAQLNQIYGDNVREIFHDIFANEKQTATLADLRDTLLPNLLSGELSIVMPNNLMEDTA